MTQQSEILGDPNYVPVLDHGFVGLVDAMPSEPAAGDVAIVQAARVSYGSGTKSVRNDRGLIRYLLRHRHTTPFEMVEFKMHLKMPIFVARQHIRHRTANVNEYSGRYSIMSPDFYVPEVANLKPQSTTNKQGREGEVSAEKAKEYQAVMMNTFQEAYRAYEQLIGEDSEDNPGIARELARSVLPVGNYTEMYWKIDLHNLFHYLSLRMDSHAQYEIQELSKAMARLIKPYVPLAYEAFEDYMVNAKYFSGPEMEILKNLAKSKTPEELLELAESAGMSKREIGEFIIKLGES